MAEGVNIPLADGFRLRSDSQQWWWERCRPSVQKEDGTWTEESWFAKGYCTNLAQCLFTYINYRMRMSGATTSKELQACLVREANTINAIDKLRVTVESLGIMP